MINSAPKLRLTAQKKYPDRRQDLVRLGPWKGVRDNGDAGKQDPQYLQDCINGWFEHGGDGGDIYARPGFQKITTTALESSNAIQGLFGIQPTTGTFFAFAFVNGKVYRQSGAAAWTDVSPVGITISTSALQVHAIVYNGEMIVSDGVNEPWRGTNLGSSPITGTEIEVNTAGNAWAARGKPTVYGGKLFFIVESIASTTYYNRIVWSEEGAAATGYLQDTYTNSWDLIQSPVASERLLAIQGTNTGLYYFRNYAIGIIYGAVNDDFVTASTHDGISSTVGMAATPLSLIHAGGPLLAGDFIYFLDGASRPARLRVGTSEIEPLWRQMANRIMVARALNADPDTTRFNNWQFAYSPDVNKVGAMCLAYTNNGTFTTNVFIFNAETGNYEGRWRVAQTAQSESSALVLSALAAVQRSDQFATAIGDSTFIVGTSTGDIYQQTSVRMTGGDVLSFGDNAGAMHFSITPMLAPDQMVTDFHVDEMHVEAFPDSATMSYDHYTPRGSVLAGSMVGITGADSIQSSHDHGIYRAALLAMGRWFRPVLYWNVPSGATPYGFERAILKVRGIKTSGVSK